MPSVPAALLPRDRAVAARIALVAVLLSVAANVGWVAAAWLEGRPHSGAGSAAVTVAVLGVFLLLAAVQLRVPGRVPAAVWPAMALLEPVGVAVVALTSVDASAAAQFPLIYGVVYAASQFRPAFAWTVAGLAVVADAVVVLTLLPLGAALRDLVVVGFSLPMITLVLVMTADVQDRLVARLDALAATDALTGLSTRRVLDDAVRRWAADGAVAPLGLVLVDLDLLKTVNDRGGHPAGDAALVHVAQVLRAVAGPSDVVARLGGDEMALLVRGGPDVVAERAAAAHALTRSAPPAGRTDLRLTVSVGWATGPALDAPAPAVPGPGAGDRVDVLYAAADRALYAAKTAGRDRVAGPHHAAAVGDGR